MKPGRRFVQGGAAAVGALALLAAACGPAPAKSPTPTAAGASPGATPTTSGTPAGGTATPEMGPPPALGGNILKVSPAHGAQVRQLQTRTLDPSRPSGLCIDVSFEGTPEYGQWFRVALDGKEVTAEKDSVWIVPSNEAPTKGTLCYAPAAGFAVGRHEAAVSVQDPKNPAAKPRQTVGWRFDVIP